jgi:O-glycosyl hydrolase
MKKSILPLSGVVCIIGALLALLTLGWGQPPMLSQQPGMFQVHPEKTFQTMVGFGAGFYAGSGLDFNYLNPIDRAHAYDLLYGEQERGTNLNILRLLISSSAPRLSPLNAQAQGLLYDWGGDPYTVWGWKAIAPVLKLKKNGLIIYAVPFSPPSCWKIFTTQNHFDTKCGDKSDPKLCGGELDPKYYKDYAEYLADFVDYYHRVHDPHVDIDILSLQNEPNIAPHWDSCVWTGSELRDFLIALVPIFQARGLNTKFMLSEGSTWNQAWLLLQATLHDSTALPLLNIMASHSYPNPFNPDDPEIGLQNHFRAASDKYGLPPVWMSEMSIIGPPEDDGMGAAMKIAQYLQRDLVNGHASVWIYCFALYRPWANNIQGSLSLLSVDPQNGALVVPKRFWTMANYSHFVRPGWKRIRIDSLPFPNIGFYSYANTGFINPQGNGFVIVALNACAKSEPATYDFGNWTIDAVEAFCTTEKLDLYHDQGHQVVPLATQPHRFTATLPPNSVTTFAGNLAAPKLLPHIGQSGGGGQGGGAGAINPKGREKDASGRCIPGTITKHTQE